MWTTRTFVLLLFIPSVVRLSSSSDDNCKFNHSRFDAVTLTYSNDAAPEPGPDAKVARLSFETTDRKDEYPNHWGWLVHNRMLRFKSGRYNHSASFNTSFHINLDVNRNTSGPGGGMAFMLLPIPKDLNPTSSNRSGKWLGLFNDTIDGQRSNNIVAIEFDTYEDDFDSDNNHIGLDLNRITSFKNQSLSGFDIDLSDGTRNITVWIDYDGPGRRLDVFMVYAGSTAASDKSSAARVFTVQDIDLGDYTSDEVYAGFAASTGAVLDRYCLFHWEFSMECFDNGESPADNNLPPGSSVEPPDNSIKSPGNGIEPPYNSIEPLPSNNSNLGIIIGVPIAAVMIAVSIIIFMFLKWRNCRQRRNNSRLTRTEVASLYGPGPRMFSYKELSKATGNFSRDNKLGSGASGMVYKATLQDGTEAAVKRIFCAGVKEFVSEVSSISRLHHRNILPLIGWSLSEDDRSAEELLLVYYYMPNGSLDRWIFAPTSEGARPSPGILDWEQRYNVLCGTAKALVYLHEGWEQTVIHRDVKASNILLDADFAPRLGDFGLARVTEHGLSHFETTNLAGTPGYIPPEVFDTRTVTKQADVYSFGIVILEVVCGRRPVYRENTDQEGKLLLDLVWKLYLEGKLVEIVDRRLAQGSYQMEDMERILKVGLLCSNPNMKERPSMSIVLQELTAKGPCSFHLPSSQPRYHRAFSSSSSHVSAADGNRTSSDST